MGELGGSSVTQPTRQPAWGSCPRMKTTQPDHTTGTAARCQKAPQFIQSWNDQQAQATKSFPNLAFQRQDPYKAMDTARSPAAAQHTLCVTSVLRRFGKARGRNDDPASPCYAVQAIRSSGGCQDIWVKSQLSACVSDFPCSSSPFPCESISSFVWTRDPGSNSFQGHPLEQRFLQRCSAGRC